MGTSRTATPASRLDAWPHRVRAALFPTVGQSIASLAALALIGLVAYAFLDWAILRAVFTGSDGSACRVPNAGACWPFIMHKLDLFLYGRYPDTELWRVKLTYALALAGLVPLMIPRVPYKLPLAIYLLAVFPVIAFVLLYGGAFGLPIVGTELWGGLLLTLVIASVGIAASFPLGILLALGRRSEMPFVRWAS
ncbi:MAG TPA: amino acid ABC transporter permease, partial [Hyphomicrobium sp.]|nr:amino acid ABC transporter permease [Hyphomicrobium sp.]